MGRLILLALLISNASAIVPENIFQDDNLMLDIIIQPPLAPPISQYSKTESLELFNRVYLDPEKRISQDFKIPDYFKTDVNFWFNIYTLYGINHVVLHDKDNLAIIYDVLNFTDVVKNIENIHTRSALQTKLALAKSKDLRELLINLSKAEAKNAVEKQIEEKITSAKITIPKDTKQRKDFFLKLADNIRAQTGQRTNILTGLKTYQSYEKFIDKSFETFELPRELRALPFLESSFNPKARSKVQAAGAYQFMPRVGKHYMTIDTNKDERLNPLISTVAAFHLLKENLRIVGSWDLAITAYNSGVKHILKAKKVLNKPNMKLEEMLVHYNHAHIGFASKNFYSEFLALVHALSYKDQIYLNDPTFVTGPHLNIDKDNLFIYVNLCNTSPASFIKNRKKISPDIDRLNKHFFQKKLSNIQKKGALFVSDKDLNSKTYRKITFDEMRKRYPKNWHLLAKNQSCSTK